MNTSHKKNKYDKSAEAVMPLSRRNFLKVTGVVGAGALCLRTAYGRSADGVSAGARISVPVLATVDVLVLGGSTEGVAAAKAAAQAGLSALVFESRPYLGEDRCAILAYGNRTAREIKQGLEDDLIEAGVPFYYGCYLLDLLVDEQGSVGGALIGNRSGWQVVRSRLLVDATDEAQAHGLLAPDSRRRGNVEAVLNVLCPEKPVAGAVPQESVKFRNRSWNRWACPLKVDLGDGSLAARARAERQARLDCFHPRLSEGCMAERLQYPPHRPALDRTGLARADRVDFSIVPPWLPETSLRQTHPPLDLEGIRVNPTPLHPRFDGLPAMTLDANRLPLFETRDVFVAGGGTGGAPAGIAAARAGADTLVVEYLSDLGGLGTEGLICNYWFGRQIGFTAEIDRGVGEIAQLATPPKRGWYPPHKSHWHLRSLDAAGGDVWFGAACLGALVRGGRVVGTVVGSPWGAGIVKAAAFVDATGSAEIAAAAGATCRVIGADHVAVQGTGLGPSHPGAAFLNNDNTFTDDSDVVNVTYAHVMARRRFKADFDTVRIVQSRERRQIVGEIELDIIDLVAGREWPDAVAMSKSNFDSHGFTVHELCCLATPDKRKQVPGYIPLRALLPRGLEGVLVTGLGMSAHRDALPVVRMQADVQNQGYAAGHMAAQCALRGAGYRDIDLPAVQRHLAEVGVIDKQALSFEEPFVLSSDRVAEAVAGDLMDAESAAVILARPDTALPLLQKAFEQAVEERRVRIVEVLLALGDTRGAEDVIAAAQAWDEGWNFRGMGQMGNSLSPVDARLVLLGRAGAPGSRELVRRRVAELTPESEFSHLRAVAIALQNQPDPEAAPYLAGLLKRPGMSGHAHLDWAEIRPRPDKNDNSVRNQSLKEIHLARALVACGDHEGLGRQILEAYAGDFRGHYLRHAQALLEKGCARNTAA